MKFNSILSPELRARDSFNLAVGRVFNLIEGRLFGCGFAGGTEVNDCIVNKSIVEANAAWDQSTKNFKYIVIVPAFTNTEHYKQIMKIYIF